MNLGNADQIQIEIKKTDKLLMPAYHWWKLFTTNTQRKGKVIEMSVISIKLRIKNSMNVSRI